LQQWTANMERGTDELYKQMHGEKWKEMRELDLARLAVQQEEAFKKQKELEKFTQENKENKEIKITGFKWI
jgi:chromatin structure-remodeling complex subunit RSC1/2